MNYKTITLALLLALSLSARADIRYSTTLGDPDYEPRLNMPAEFKVYVNGAPVPQSPSIVTVTANWLGDGAVYSLKMPLELEADLKTYKVTVRIGKVEVWQRVKANGGSLTP